MNGSYEIRLESIGGLGAHLAGQILAEAAVLGMGLNGAHFSSYGSEKKGTPVKSYVRLVPGDREIRTTSPVREPDLVAVFHEALLTDPGVTAGLKPGGTLIVNSTAPAAEIAARVPVGGIRVISVDATGAAVAEKTRVNTAMLGAISRAAAVIDPDAVRQAIRNTFERKYPHLVEANLQTFDRCFHQFDVCLSPEQTGAVTRPATGPAVGYLTAPVGGILPTAGNTIARNMGISRQGYLPVFHRELCADCGVCDLVCPDFCLVWEPTGRTINGYPGVRLIGIDYQYCKGCLHCVQECPTGALTKERESGDIAERLRVPLFGPRLVAAAAEGPLASAAEGR